MEPHADVRLHQAQLAPLGFAVREVPLDAPFEWLARGWRDLCTVPFVSLAYGALFTLIAWVFVFGLSLIDADSSTEFPTPATLAMAPDKVYVGRLRGDLTRDRALNFWVVADNVRKCAAHNAVSVAQILVNRSQ